MGEILSDCNELPEDLRETEWAGAVVGVVWFVIP